MSTNIEFSSGTCQQSIELGLIQSLSRIFSKTQAHIAVANVEAAALCLHLIWKVWLNKIPYRWRSIIIRVIFKSIMDEPSQSSKIEECKKIQNFIIYVIYF